MQLMELDVPMVLYQQMDEVMRKRRFCAREPDGRDQYPGLSRFPLQKRGNQGNWKATLSMWQIPGKTGAERTSCEANDHGGAVHRALHAIMHLIEDHAARADIPVRFAASKLRGRCADPGAAGR